MSDQIHISTATVGRMRQIFEDYRHNTLVEVEIDGKIYDIEKAVEKDYTMKKMDDFSTPDRITLIATPRSNRKTY